MEHIAQIRSELRYLVRELGLLDRNCWKSNLSLMQAHILTYLNRNGDTCFAELCTQLNVEKASLSRVLNTLSSKGYIGLFKEPADKRQKRISLLPQGKKALELANYNADIEVSDILDGLNELERGSIWQGLRLLRTKAFRRNLDESQMRIQMERLKSTYHDEVIALMIDVFSKEQEIPNDLIPINEDYPVYWWCARAGEYVVGAVACWKENEQWHWGRFAVDKNFRGLGIGKQLARYSFEDLFDHITSSVVSDARDTTVAILKGFGAIITAPAEDFYGMPVTPVSLKRTDFYGMACAE